MRIEMMHFRYKDGEPIYAPLRLASGTHVVATDTLQDGSEFGLALRLDTVFTSKDEITDEQMRMLSRALDAYRAEHATHIADIAWSWE